MLTDLEKSELINKLNDVLIESSEDNMLLLELIGSKKEKYSFDDVNECIKKTRDKQAKIRKKVDDAIKSKNN